MNRTTIIVSLTLVLMCTALSCQFVMPERYIDYNKGRVPVNLPREMKSSDRDYNLEKESAVIITVTRDGRMYLGTDHSAIDVRDLAAKIKPLLESRRPDDRIAYLAVDIAADYGKVVAVCDEVRKIESARAGLLVNRMNDDWPSPLAVDLSPEPNPNEDINTLRPNPLTLVTTITPKLEVKLNQDPIGSIGDLSPLSEKLQQIFELRLEQHAYKVGYEDRFDLPESERVEKTITINAPKSVKYGDVVKVIDVIKGAGANPIVLQLDEVRKLNF